MTTLEKNKKMSAEATKSESKVKGKISVKKETSPQKLQKTDNKDVKIKEVKQK